MKDLSYNGKGKIAQYFISERFKNFTSKTMGARCNSYNRKKCELSKLCTKYLKGRRRAHGQIYILPVLKIKPRNTNTKYVPLNIGDKTNIVI